MRSMIYELSDKTEKIEKKAVYFLTAKSAIVNYIKQMINKDANWWTYPEWIEGMYESQTKKNVFYYDTGNGTIIQSVEC